MPEQDTKEWAEQNFKAFKNQLKKLQEELRNNKPKENINVRRVDSENLQNEDTDQIIVEYSVQRWYSIEYFRQMIQSSENNNDLDGENLL